MIADSTFLIDFLRGKESAVKMLNEVSSESIATTEINVFELVTGAHLKKDGPAGHMQKVQAMISRMIVLPLDRKSSMIAGEIAASLIKQGTPIEETDCLIAGIALANGEKEIITANKVHFERIPGIKTLSC